MLSVILVLALLASGAFAPTPAHAGGVVAVCDETHLLAALAGGGTVTFACSGTITLTATIAISAGTTIDGSGQAVTISGNDAVRVFDVPSGVALHLAELTVANGNAGLGAGVFIDNDATLSASNVTFADNTASGWGGGVYGGAVHNRGTLAVTGSTFSGNSAGAAGGGLFNYNGDMVISNSTFSGNSAGAGGGTANVDATLTLKNTIVANSPLGDNCSGVIDDGGGNLSYPDTSCPGANADPALGPLQDNGGPTWTMAPGEDSAAIDAADDATCAAPPINSLDQRGVSRPRGPHCDIGAVEQIVEPTSVRLSALSARSRPGALAPVLVAGVLLLAVASGGRRRRHAAF
jgi:hypothetical protein